MGPCNLHKEKLQSHLVQGKEGGKVELVYKKAKEGKAEERGVGWCAS